MAIFETKKRLKKQIEDLLKLVAEKDDELIYMEKLVSAYISLGDYTHTELINADQTIKAHEQVEELMVDERRSADQTIKAHEQVEKLMVNERRSADRIIKAHEKLENLAFQEQIEAEETIDAMQKLDELKNKEQRESHSIIKAHEEISNLSIIELKMRDDALRNILEINKSISSFLDEEDLLEKILTSLINTIHAKRGILFLKKAGKLTPEKFHNLNPKEYKNTSFNASKKLIETAVKKQKSQIKINKKIKKASKNIHQSIIVIPMMYESDLLGLLYVDILSTHETFRTIDIEIAEIFGSQAAISIHNSILYQKIKEKNRELLKLVNIRNQFLSHVSGKIIEPLNSIRTLFSKHLELKNNNQKEKNLKQIHSYLNKMDNTVTKVISVISLEEEAENLFCDTVDFNKLIEEIIERHKSEKENKNITIKTSLSKHFKNYKANKTLIKTVLDELISNAIFYNRKNGKIEIIGQRDGETLIIKITDTGHGIRQDDLEKVFHQFYRTKDSSKSNEYGAGLGLYMTRLFIAQYGGKVEVKSKLKKGTTFTLEFVYH